MRIRLLAICSLLAVLAISVAACGVPKSGSFSPISPSKIPDQLTETTTTTTTTTTMPPSTTSTIVELQTTTTVQPTTTSLPAALITMYFLSGTQLVPVDQLVSNPFLLFKVVQALADGPQGPSVANYRTAIPHDVNFQVSQDPRTAVVTVVLPTDFFDKITDLPDQRLAIAQIVLTLTKLSGISQVRFSQNDLPKQVLLGNGELSAPDQLLYFTDYAALLAQGPPDTTTTTTVATSTSLVEDTASATSTTAAPPA